MIEVKNLRKTYKPKKGKEVQALKGINLKFEEKGLVFILGKSGSGKSTLLNMLGGLDKFDEGEIIIKGKSSEKFTQSDFDSYRNTFIGFIFQEYNILNDFTVGANIALAMELQGKKPTKEALNNILNEVDLEGFASRKPNELSGGQKQRVAIARALIKNPEIIMADEPTGALDSNTGKQVFDTLKKLSRNKLVIVVSHDREFAEQYGDRVIELADGEVISDIKKYIAKPSNVSEGIDIIEDKLIHIKSGYELTQKDLEMINDYLRRNKNADSFISIDSKTNDDIKRAVRIDEEGNRENFKDTNDSNLNVKEYNPEDFNLIRSKLPLKNSLKMAFGSLKKKPFRLVMTILLSTVSFTLFGLVNTMSSYKDIEAGTDSIIDSNVDYTAFVKETYVDNGDWGYYHSKWLADEDIDIIQNKFPDLKFTKVADRSDIALSFENNLFDTEKIDVNAEMSYYTKQFYGAACIDNDVVSDLGYKLEGSLPSSDNGIVITKYAAESFVKAGYKKEYTQDKATDIKKESDMIGKILSLNLTGEIKEYTIAGILDTNYNGSRYDKYKDEIKGGTGLKDYIIASEMQDVKAYSFHDIVYTTQTVVDKVLECNKGQSVWNDKSDISYLYKEQDEFMGIQKVVQQNGISEDIKANVVMFNGKDINDENCIGENDVVIPLSVLQGYGEYVYDLSEKNMSISEIKSLINESKDKIMNMHIVMQVSLIKDGWVPKDKDVNIAGVYIDDKYDSMAIVDNGFYERYSIETGGKYSAVLADMPEDRDEVEELVNYSLDNGIENTKYILKNCTSYTIDIVNTAISQSKTVLLYIGVFFAVFAAIMLMNFIATSISYKKREIGILRAVGARGTDVFKIFFNESLIIAIINWLFSVGVTGTIVHIINSKCRNDINLVITILHFGIIQLGIMLLISVGVAFVASFVPVFKVSRKKPIEAIRKN